VATVAFIGEDRPDIAIEQNRAIGAEGGNACQKESEDRYATKTHLILSGAVKELYRSPKGSL
jgi:hypothetical protein